MNFGLLRSALLAFTAGHVSYPGLPRVVLPGCGINLEFPLSQMSISTRSMELFQRRHSILLSTRCKLMSHSLLMSFGILPPFSNSRSWNRFSKKHALCAAIRVRFALAVLHSHQKSSRSWQRRLGLPHRAAYRFRFPALPGPRWSLQAHGL